MSIHIRYNGIYNDIKQGIYDTLVDSFNNSDVRMDVYKAPFQNINIFPAITIETVARTKQAKGMGVSVYNVDYYVWVYTNVMDSLEAEEQCLEYTRMAEEFLLNNKNLGGKCSNLSLDNDEIQFGVIEKGENNFIQGARIPVRVTTGLISDRTPCGGSSGGDCSCD